MYQQKTSQSYLLKQNQELKMEITELRNAFNINKQILQILSENKDVNKKHFYTMLKKLNEHLYDIAEYQLELRREKIEKEGRIRELEDFVQQFEDDAKFKEALHETNLEKVFIEDKKIIQAKESHVLLMDEIKRMTSEIQTMKQDYSKLKTDNLELRKRIKKLKSCSNCKYDNSTFQQDSQSQNQYQMHSKLSKRIGEKVRVDKQTELKMEKLVKMNDHLNYMVGLLSTALSKVAVVKKRAVKGMWTEERRNVVIELIRDRIDMDYLDYQGFIIMKRNVRGKSV